MNLQVILLGYTCRMSDEVVILPDPLIQADGPNPTPRTIQADGHGQQKQADLSRSSHCHGSACLHDSEEGNNSKLRKVRQ